MSQGQLFSHSSIFTSPQTQSRRNMWFWWAHMQGWGQLKHQYTMITYNTAAMRTTCQIKLKSLDSSSCFQSCLVLWELCSQADKQWLCIHSTFSSRQCWYCIILVDVLNRGVKDFSNLSAIVSGCCFNTIIHLHDRTSVIQIWMVLQPSAPHAINVMKSLLPPFFFFFIHLPHLWYAASII